MKLPQVVHVTGMGVRAPFAANVADFAAALRTGRHAIAEHEVAPLAAPVAASWWPAEHAVDVSFDVAARPGSGLAVLAAAARRSTRRSTRSIRAVAAACLEAWADAGLTERTVPAERIALVVGGETLTLGAQRELARRFADGVDFVPPRHGVEFLDTHHVGVLSEIFGVRGPGSTVGGASASGNLALASARQLIACGAADLCLVVGPVAELGPLELQALRNLGALAAERFAGRPAEACRPFDVQHAGFVPGHAAVAMILESDTSARRRQQPARAWLAGAAVCLDGTQAPTPAAAGELRAMRSALADARLGSRAVDYVSSHGTSSAAGDTAEAEAIRTLFGSDPRGPWINATKGITGHCLWSAGLVEAVACVLQLEGQFVHPNRNLCTPIVPELRWAGAEARSCRLEIALSNSFGFGGINSSLVMCASGERRPS